MNLTQAFKNRKVLVTGHTGFKGSWLAYWLNRMGAEVCGYALQPPTTPSHWHLMGLDVCSVEGDIRDEAALTRTMTEFQPEIVLHLAAQPLVRQSYQDPSATFSTNVMGTLALLEACRHTASVRAVLIVTSDKCYENREWLWGYRENDPMGGHDPYSASKGCAELLTASYRQSFFPPDQYGKKHHVLVASCRAGNVVGGGDWADDRLVPDLVRSTTSGRPIEIRNPKAIRPWQHVLECLSGYLCVAQQLMAENASSATAWNFGPDDDASVPVDRIALACREYWDRIQYRTLSRPDQPHEANWLKLDSSKARHQLGWQPVWNWRQSLDRTIGWYKTYYEGGEISTESDIAAYERDMSLNHEE